MGEDMNDLPVGLELDRLIAEKVMGWTNEGGIWRGTGAADRFVRRCEVSECWCPSEDIGDAWEVVQYLEGTDLGWTLNLYSQGGCWSAGFEDSTPENICTGRHVGLTAPHAICLAALTVMKMTP